MAGHRRRVSQLGGAEMARSIIQDRLGLTTFDQEYLGRMRAATDRFGTYLKRANLTPANAVAIAYFR